MRLNNTIVSRYLFYVMMFFPMVITSPSDLWSEEKEIAVQTIIDEIDYIKRKIKEVEDLKERLAELEKILTEKESQPVTAAFVTEEESDESGIKLGAWLSFNYSYQDWNREGRSRGGDMALDFLGLTLNGSLNDMILSTEYRWYSYMDVIVQAWIGYNFNEHWQGQVGVMKVPFGLLPYDSHNYWFGIPFYVGLSDNYDMGVKLTGSKDPWDIRLAFFKNEEWGDSSNKGRYTIDIIRESDSGQYNEDINRFNARFAYTFHHTDGNRTELGISGQIGQLYNSETDESGSHWAGALHLNGFYGPYNLMLQAARYEYNPENPDGVSNNTVLVGGFEDTNLLASKGMVYSAGLSYDLPVNWGPISKLTFYNDNSFLVKDENDFNDSQLHALGLMVTAEPVYTFIDFYMSRNMVWLGGENNPMAEGVSDADWNTLFNINFAYYY